MLCLAAALLAALLAATGDGPITDRLSLTADLDAPAAAVVRLFAEVDRYPRVFPSIKRADIKRRKPGQSTAYVEIDFPWPIGPRWLLGEVQATADRVTWHRLEGTFRRYDGSLRVVGLAGGRSRVTYEAVVDPGIPAPVFIAEWMQGRVLVEILADARRYLRDHAEELARSTSAR